MASKKMQQLARELSLLAGKNATAGKNYQLALEALLGADLNALDELLSGLTGQEKMLLAHKGDREGKTLIHKIAEIGSETLHHFKTLNKHKIFYPELPDFIGKRPIHFLVEHESEYEGFKYLIDQNVDTDTPMGNTKVNVGHLLALNRRIEWLEYMFRNNRDLSQVNDKGETVEAILTSIKGADWVNEWRAKIMIAQIEVAPAPSAALARNRRAL